MSFLQTVNWNSYGWLYYLTHWSVVLSNTFITSSSGIIMLLTINYFKNINNQNTPELIKNSVQAEGGRRMSIYLVKKKTQSYIQRPVVQAMILL